MNRTDYSIEQLQAMARGARFRPAELAWAWSISLRQMERIFARRFNMTPAKWLRTLRFRTATELIGKGTPIKAVAGDLGFASLAHFCKEFKRMCGKTPGSYRLAVAKSYEGCKNAEMYVAKKQEKCVVTSRNASSLRAISSDE